MNKYLIILMATEGVFQFVCETEKTQEEILETISAAVATSQSVIFYSTGSEKVFIPNQRLTRSVVRIINHNEE